MIMKNIYRIIYEEFFKEELRSKLLFINAEETILTDEEVESVEEGNMEILEATRASYEISNRNKARPAVKLLVLLNVLFKYR